MIKINNITKRYGDTLILEEASYNFPQKGLVCLMGASGGGKTTLLNLLAGFDNQYEGEIVVGETLLNAMDDDTLCSYRRDNIGFVFQNYNLLSGYTVLENILLSCEQNKKKAEQGLNKAKILLEKLGIAQKEKEKIENLSGGQKQRVAIARALVNQPQIIFADEPTGALDRAASTEIMTLLKEISEEKLVIVITHDKKVCDFADEVISIKDRKILLDTSIVDRIGHTISNSTNDSIGDTTEKGKKLIFGKRSTASTFQRAVKNFTVHKKRYLAVSVAISIGMFAFLFSLSFGNIMQQSITHFKTKNTVFNNGYIKGNDDGMILDFLKKDERIENVYYQYILSAISFNYLDRSETMTEKIPTPKSIQALSYGVMPRWGKNELAITPSLAKKFASDIKTMIGKQMTLTVENKNYPVTISGIYNAGYDDFCVSSDIEQTFYHDKSTEENYSISYDVKEFSDIVSVSEQLKEKNIDSQNVANEVAALQNTFESLNKLFLVISILILGIGLFLCIVLLSKLQNTRYHEVGLLAALGFHKSRIRLMILEENVLLSTLATLVNLLLLTGVMVFGKIMTVSFSITGIQLVISVITTFAIIMLVSSGVSYKLVRMEPADALR